MKTYVAYFNRVQGSWKVVGLCDSEGNTVVDEFLHAYRASEKSAIPQMLYLLEQHIPLSAPPFGTNMCCHLRDGIYRLKKGRLRVFWFEGPWNSNRLPDDQGPWIESRPLNQSIVCTHGWLRGDDQEYEKQIAKAIESREDFFVAIPSDVEIVPRVGSGE